jgi:hypothetical protein
VTTWFDEEADMKRLDILLIGASQAMTELAQELEQHGHSLQRSGVAASTVDLIIDDGFIGAGDFCAIPHLHLRLGVGAQSAAGLPTLDLLCFLGSSLISRVPVADEPSGNGQALRQRVLTQVVDEVALLVSRFSRDADYLQQATLVRTPDFERMENLLFLDSLAYVHRFNDTANSVLLQQAQIPVIERLQQSLIRHAERPALHLAEQSISYRQLHAHSRAIQQRLQPLLEQHPQPWVVGICLPKSPGAVRLDSGDPRQRCGVPAAGAEPSVAAPAIHSAERWRTVVAA